MSEGEEIASKIAAIGATIAAAKAEKKPKEEWESSLKEMLALKVNTNWTLEMMLMLMMMMMLMLMLVIITIKIHLFLIIYSLIFSTNNDNYNIMIIKSLQPYSS
jgi:hypothetical protein